MHFFEQLSQTIQQFDTIIIHRHVSPDPDALGSQLGLAQLIRDNFSKTVYCVGGEVDNLKWVGTMDNVADEVYAQALVIVVDTANTERIDDSRYLNGKQLIKIDHHPNNDVYGDLVYVDTTASSASEIICQFAFAQQLTMSKQTAAYLYTGIVGDTNRFLYPNATAKTMLIVSQLREMEFDNVAIHQQMTEMSLQQARFSGYVLENLDVSENGVASLVITRDILRRYGLEQSDVGLVVSVPNTITDIKTWAFFSEKEDGTYRVNLRSKELIINGIAQEHDGGGHPLASGANAKDTQEITEIIGKLNELVKRGY